MALLARSSVLAALLAAVLTLPGGGAAAPSSTTFSIVGYEYGFTATRGRFAGVASGDGTHGAAWNAVVDHDRLGSTPTYIDGGAFQMVTHKSGLDVGTVTGTFVHHGGTIHLLDAGANCRNQRYAVSGRLRQIGHGGTGLFDVVLTHYRMSFVGYCVIYKARVAGHLSFRD